MNFEVIPLCKAFGVQIVLQNKVVHAVLDLTYRGGYLKDCHEVGRLEVGIEDQVVIADHALVLGQFEAAIAFDAHKQTREESHLSSPIDRVIQVSLEDKRVLFVAVC